jgi:GNAT superfamily N-acetyltransferase
MTLSEPVPISTLHETENFDCGQPDLNNWLKRRAIRNEARFSRTYVVCDGTRVAGYYCISAAQIERAAAPKRLGRNAPDAIPVSIIGRLAVDSAYAGRGVGSAMLADAFRRICVAAKIMGVAAVLVHAKNETAKAFYMASAEFIEYPEDSRILFLPIETLTDAL